MLSRWLFLLRRITITRFRFFFQEKTIQHRSIIPGKPRDDSKRVGEWRSSRISERVHLALDI